MWLYSCGSLELVKNTKFFAKELFEHKNDKKYLENYR